MKCILTTQNAAKVWSPPAWGAWIEISKPEQKTNSRFVAPRVGGVD